MQPKNQEESSGWQYKSEAASNPAPTYAGENATAPNQTALPAVGGLEWTASEFVAHDKGFGWYLLLAAGTLGVAALTFALTRDRVSTAVILIFGIILGIVAGRKPRVVTYRLQDTGVSIGPRFYPLSVYKSFTIKDEGPFVSVELAPMKRFGFPLSMYLAPENERQVVEELSRHLPLKQEELGGMERLMRHLRF